MPSNRKIPPHGLYCLNILLSHSHPTNSKPFTYSPLRHFCTCDYIALLHLILWRYFCFSLYLLIGCKRRVGNGCVFRYVRNSRKAFRNIGVTHISTITWCWRIKLVTHVTSCLVSHSRELVNFQWCNNTHTGLPATYSYLRATTTASVYKISSPVLKGDFT